MDIRSDHDTESPAEQPEVYEPPMLEEIGDFAVITRANSRGSVVDGNAYYSR
ncbi:MAG: lasso RiPP family leader peptide-containing protein [Pseudonocardiaceae bacterium]